MNLELIVDGHSAIYAVEQQQFQPLILQLLRCRSYHRFQLLTIHWLKACHQEDASIQGGCIRHREYQKQMFFDSGYFLDERRWSMITAPSTTAAILYHLGFILYGRRWSPIAAPSITTAFLCHLGFILDET